MKAKNNKLLYLVTLLVVFGLLVVSCNKEDNTGYSTLKVKSPTITITPGFTSPVVLVENDEKYEFTVTLSEPQIVDVHLAVAQVDGTASADDYELTGTVVIPAGSTSGKGNIKILSDAVIEDDETLTIQIGDEETANASLTPLTVEFTIKNLTVDDLTIGLSWAAATPTTDDTGTEIDPTALADMRLLITNNPYTEIIDGADGGSFETFVMPGTMDDGEYLIVADFYDAMASPVRDLNLEVSFAQLGVIDEYAFDFPAAINTGYICDLNYFILAKVVKAGNSYTIEKLGEKPARTPWFGTDTEFGYPSEIETIESCDGMLMYGINAGWMYDFWGEEIIDEGNVIYTIDENDSVHIESQYIFTTLYDGDEYPYTVSGKGYYDNSGDYPVITLEYVLDQEGFDPGQWCFDNGYMSTPYFTAEITLNPNVEKSASIIERTGNNTSSVLTVKPRR
ncbi:Calx-beta domain-containing protein [Saccharicrinis sp. FJH2]|uniref:Calx-beta domain-containing protein n=1 Tax=Saccharicrinis sp. FJH65 TaxID=3344659 RepID=UPI0035F47874